MRFITKDYVLGSCSSCLPFAVNSLTRPGVKLQILRKRIRKKKNPPVLWRKKAPFIGLPFLSRLLQRGTRGGL